MKQVIRLGSRTSIMARAVAEHAKGLIEDKHPDCAVQLLSFASQGDLYQGDLKKMGGKGAFVSDLENRLLKGEIDCAIHALKDIPGDIEPHPDLVICSFLERADPRDALIMRRGADIPTKDTEGLVIGTSSLRRQAQLALLYPGVTSVPLRGNVDTRIRKLDDGEFDGIVVSYSGLGYLNRADRATKVYSPEEMLPAVGQGVLCLQIRRADFERCPHLLSLNAPLTEAVVQSERHLLKTLQGNCHSAIAGHCTRDDRGLTLSAAVFQNDGSGAITWTETVSSDADAKDLGEKVGEKLLSLGAAEIIQSTLSLQNAC